MTVAELIAALQKRLHDDLVVVQHYDDMGYSFSVPMVIGAFARRAEDGTISWINEPFCNDPVVRVTTL